MPLDVKPYRSLYLHPHYYIETTYYAIPLKEIFLTLLDLLVLYYVVPSFDVLPGIPLCILTSSFGRLAYAPGDSLRPWSVERPTVCQPIHIYNCDASLRLAHHSNCVFFRLSTDSLRRKTMLIHEKRGSCLRECLRSHYLTRKSFSGSYSLASHVPLENLVYEHSRRR